MQSLNGNLETRTTRSGYKFSTVSLGGQTKTTEKTYATLVLDCSGSMTPYQADTERCLKEIVAGLKADARAATILLRVVLFGSGMHEVHGFKPVTHCAPDDYTGCLKNMGLTELFDTSFACIESLGDACEEATKDDYDVNGIIIVMTDGGEYASRPARHQPDEIKGLIVGTTGKPSLVQQEKLQSLRSILIGLNGCDNTAFAKEAGFDQYVDAGQLNAKTFQKIVGFAVASVSTQSQAISTGRPSQALTF